MKSKYEKLELKLTMFKDDFDIVRTSGIGAASFDPDWSMKPWEDGTNGKEMS